jgi:hypothetical protein
MRNLKKSLLMLAAASLVIVSTVASAGYVISTTITRVRASEFGVYYVYVQAPITRVGTEATTSCSSAASANTTNIFALDPTTSGGKAMLNTVLVAKASGALVTVVGRASQGTGFSGALACNLSPGSTTTNGIESINYLEME